MLGNRTSEESTYTRICQGAQTVVVSVEYRMAPDWPYPAAVEDVSHPLLVCYDTVARNSTDRA